MKRREWLQKVSAGYLTASALSTLTGTATAQTTLTFDSTDLDNAAAQTGVVHESVSNTDHNDESVLKQGYSIGSPYLPPDLVGYWPMQEDSGSTAYDFGGSGNDGTYNGPTLSQPGLLGTSAPEFDGIDDVVSVPQDSTLDVDTGTLSFWVKGTNDDVRLYHDGTTQFETYIETSSGSDYPAGSYRFASITSGGSVTVNTSSAVNDGNWHHLVGTFDGSEVAVYFDGVQQDSTPASGTLGPLGNDIYFGGDGINNIRYWDGLMADVRMYNRALSSSEIQTLYNVVDTAGELLTQPKVS